jgi:hypothetical protein
MLTLLALLPALPAVAQAPVPARANNIAAELVAAGPVVPGAPLELRCCSARNQAGTAIGRTPATRDLG